MAGADARLAQLEKIKKTTAAAVHGGDAPKLLPEIAVAAAFADVLDGISAGMFLLDRAGRIVHANASGHALLREGTVLRSAGGNLAACEARSARALAGLLAIARDGAAVSSRALAVPLSTRDGEHYVARLLPLASAARRPGARHAAVAAVFVHKAVLQAPAAPEVIARTFNLTPGELCVLLAIVEVGGVPKAAQALGIAEATVKTHLHRLFCKSGATRQADLVKLVAAFSNPLVGGSTPRSVTGRGHRIGGCGTAGFSPRS